MNAASMSPERHERGIHAFDRTVAGNPRSFRSRLRAAPGERAARFFMIVKGLLLSAI
jgi:hypothetical protein